MVLGIPRLTEWAPSTTTMDSPGRKETTRARVGDSRREKPLLKATSDHLAVPSSTSPSSTSTSTSSSSSAAITASTTSPTVARRAPLSMDQRRRIARALTARFYLLHQNGPNAFVVCSDDPTSSYKVLLGPQSCSCKQQHCMHLLFVMLRVLKVNVSDPRLFTKTLHNYECEALVKDFRACRVAKGLRAPLRGRTQHYQDCPICLLEMVEGEAMLSCPQCSNHMHRNCMQVWANSRVAQREAVVCPLCRTHWTAASSSSSSSSSSIATSTNNNTTSTSSSSSTTTSTSSLSSSDAAALNKGLPWAADASLPVCNPIPAEQQAASRPWVQAYGAHVVACLFSDDWSVREAALHKVNYEFKLLLPQPDALIVTSTLKILERALRDPVLKVFVAALEIVQSLTPEAVSDYADALAPILNLVIPNCAEKNKRKRDLSIEAVMELIGTSNFVFDTVLARICSDGREELEAYKTGVNRCLPWRWWHGRLNLLTELMKTHRCYFVKNGAARLKRVVHWYAPSVKHTHKRVRAFASDLAKQIDEVREVADALKNGKISEEDVVAQESALRKTVRDALKGAACDDGVCHGAADDEDEALFADWEAMFDLRKPAAAAAATEAAAEEFEKTTPADAAAAAASAADAASVTITVSPMVLVKRASSTDSGVASDGSTSSARDSSDDEDDTTNATNTTITTITTTTTPTTPTTTITAPAPSTATSPLADRIAAATAAACALRCVKKPAANAVAVAGAGAGAAVSKHCPLVKLTPAAIITSPLHLDVLSLQQHTYVEGVNWKRGKMLGSGGFSSVFTAVDVKTDMEMAFKQVPFCSNSPAEEQQLLRTIQSEIDIMRQLPPHPHVVTYLGACCEGNHFNIFMEKMAGGSLSTFAHAAGGLPVELVRMYTAQVVEGLAFLHAHGIIHRDLKGCNILLDETHSTVKVADFGASAVLSSHATVSREFASVHGTAAFMAPELIRGEAYGRAVDVWSLGCCVVEMAAGRAPWADEGIVNQFALMFRIATGVDLPRVPAALGECGEDFVRMCLNRDAKARPSVADMAAHPFIKEL